MRINTVTLAGFRDTGLGKDCGVGITDIFMARLCTRNIVATDMKRNIIYTELVAEIVQEPDYDNTLAAF